MSLWLWLSPALVPVLALVAAVARPGRATSWVLVAAPVPALVIALLGDVLPPPSLSWLLLDVRLAADGMARVLLILTAAVWMCAGHHIRPTAERHRGFAALWLLSLAGNVGLLLAADAITFYAAFVVMTLAAYGLVVHDGSRKALRAGRVYLVLGVAGEVVLLAGLLLAAATAGSLLLDDLSAAVLAAPHRDLTLALLLTGFGLKAGVIGLHMWLPLAHPAAPFAASAVLSGAMIKAGLVGWVRFLPIGVAPLPAWSTLVIVLGLLTAFTGVLLGLPQRDPKVVLAYSSVSQMGFITVLVGVALGTPSAAPLALAAAAVYALHHGLAKAVLFLGVGLLGRSPSSRRRAGLMAGTALAAVSLAGFPVTSGAAAKAWAKQAVDAAGGGGTVGLALSFAAVGTTVLMARLCAVLRVGDRAAAAVTGPGSPGPAVAAGLGPWTALVAAVAVLTFVVPARILDLAAPVPTLAASGEALWPVVAGIVIAGVAVVVTRSRPSSLPTIPPGDLVVVAEWAVERCGRGLAALTASVGSVRARIAGGLQRSSSRLARWDQGVVDRAEDLLTRWRTGGVLIGLLTIAVLQALRWDVA